MWGILRGLKCLYRRLLVVKSRGLTVAEIQLIRSVFGDALDVDRVKIVAHRAILRHYAMSPNGNIYFNPADWCEDFSVVPLVKQSWFIHEMTHVWQVQQGIAVVRKALLDRRYRYQLQPNKTFLNYGIEQQAQMVQDYFLKKHLGHECSSYQQCIPFLPI